MRLPCPRLVSEPRIRLRASTPAPRSPGPPVRSLRGSRVPPTPRDTYRFLYVARSDGGVGPMWPRRAPGGVVGSGPRRRHSQAPSPCRSASCFGTAELRSLSDTLHKQCVSCAWLPAPGFRHTASPRCTASVARLPAHDFRLASNGFRRTASGFPCTAPGARLPAHGFRLRSHGFRRTPEL